MKKENKKYTRKEIEDIVEGLNVICFRKRPGTSGSLAVWDVYQYPKADPCNESCIWREPQPTDKVVASVLPSFDVLHSYGAPSLFKPTLEEIIEAMPVEQIGIANAVHIQYNGFTEDNAYHKSIVTPYVIVSSAKILAASNHKDMASEFDKYNHPSGKTVGSLAEDKIINEDCLVSIDMYMPDSGNIKPLFLGKLKDVPDEYKDCGFRPINTLGVIEDDAIHIIIN